MKKPCPHALMPPKPPHAPPYPPICLQISNIRNMRANMEPKYGHISKPRPFPKVRI